jgi:hypothetical protein
MQYRASCKDPEPQDGINLAESQNTAYCLESFHATQARRTAPFTTLRAGAFSCRPHSLSPPCCLLILPRYWDTFPSRTRTFPHPCSGSPASSGRERMCVRPRSKKQGAMA